MITRSYCVPLPIEDFLHERPLRQDFCSRNVQNFVDLCNLTWPNGLNKKLKHWGCRRNLWVLVTSNEIRKKEFMYWIMLYLQALIWTTRTCALLVFITHRWTIIWILVFIKWLNFAICNNNYNIFFYNISV